MLIKIGVDVSKLKSEIRKTLPLVEVALKRVGYEITITATYDGNHSAGSLHYAHLAYDVRAPLNRETCKNVVTSIKASLGSAYDVCDEVNHIHIEYDPK